MTVCNELHEELEKAGCIPKSGTYLRKARGTFQEVSGKTLKKCVDGWLDQGLAKPCNCPCNGVKAIQQNNTHPNSEVTEELTSLDETWGLPRFGSKISAMLDTARNFVDEALTYKPVSEKKKGFFEEKPVRALLRSRPIRQRLRSRGLLRNRILR